MQPRHGLEGSRRPAPTRRPATVRWDACTTRASAARAVLWRTRHRPAPAVRSGTPGPMRRTRGTPTCRAWRSHRRYKDDSSPCCGRSCALPEAADLRDRPPATLAAHSDKTVSTTIVLQDSGALHFAHLRTDLQG